MIAPLLYIMGFFVAYFGTWVTFGAKRTLGTALIAFILALFSWLGVAFLVITYLIFKVLRSEKEF